MEHIQLAEGKRLYFASDFHLGSHLPGGTEREASVVAWLEDIRSTAQVIFLLGDVFEFWFEYRRAVPKGFTRFLGKLASLRAEGVDIRLFTGNHDLWFKDYFPAELGIHIYRHPVSVQVTAPGGRQTLLHMGHGDGLGPGDHYYKKILKPIFTSRLAQWLFRALHPDVGVWLAHRWSGHSRATKAGVTDVFHAREKEWIWHYCREVEARQHHDYYVFGHRHLLMQLALDATQKSTYFNIGDWISYRTFGIFDGDTFILEAFGKSGPLPIHRA